MILPWRRPPKEGTVVRAANALRIECELGPPFPRMPCQDLAIHEVLHASFQGAPFTVDHRACRAERIWRCRMMARSKNI